MDEHTKVAVLETGVGQEGLRSNIRASLMSIQQNGSKAKGDKGGGVPRRYSL